MRKLFKNIIVSALVCFGIQSLVHAEDVSSWALPEYSKAANAGVVTYNVISQNLKESITREEFCELSVALYERLTDDTIETPDVSPFSDSDNPAVSRAYFCGLVSGTSDTTFEPERFVTRQEMAKILENVLNVSEVSYGSDSDNSKLPLFNDASSISEWAVPSVSVITRHSIMGGSDGKFDPFGNATREQAILCVYRAFEAFSDDTTKSYSMKCSAPVSGQTITGGECRINASSIANATKYFIVIKDENGDLVKSMTVSSPSAFKINKSTLPYGDNYSLTVGAKAPDGTEVFSSPTLFNFEEPEFIEPEPIEVMPEPEKSDKKPLTDTTSEKTEVKTEVPTQTIVEEETLPQLAPNTSENKKEEVDMTIGFEDEVTSDKAKALIKEAEKYLGIPYVYGGTTPDGFDCSGFVKYVFAEMGITLKRVSRDQYAHCGTKVERKDLQPGDLVFFGSNGVVGHVGIYTGKGQMIHSPSTGKTICYTSIESNYYKSHYIGAKRIF